MSKNEKLEDGSQRKSPRLIQVDGLIDVPGLKPNSKLQTQNMKQNPKQQEKKNIFIEDLYEKAQNAKEMIRRNTGLVYDPRMVNHKNLWDEGHQECPDRFIKTVDRCKELGLVDRCQPIKGRKATLAELLSVHSQAHIDVLRQTDSCTDVDHLEQVASNYDAVYIHPETYQSSLLSAGCTIELVHAVCTGTVQNGMAIVRPPGHHAMQSDFCGYCFFNNVAVAANYILDNTDTRKILIVDWDVHHGQATQQMFYNDPRVVYFSIHRYEHGEFWPNLRESEFDYVGEGPGVGYNFNVPLNKTNMGNADYLAIFHQVLLPMASEFQPDLIIVSAGFDAAVGCPEGEMSVTPACYAHLVSSLMSLACGKVAVILEGGYCVRSLAESAALTLRALLGDPCPNLPVLSAPSQSVQESILNCIYSHRPFWKCFQLQGSYRVCDRDPENVAQHWPEVHFNFNGLRMKPYPTRNTYPVLTQATKEDTNKKLDLLIAETKLFKTKHDVAFVYDPLMMEHKNLKDPGHPENPNRIQRIYERFLDYSLLDRLFALQGRYASREELLLVHEEAYLNEIEQLCASTEHMTDDAKYKHAILEKKNSVYIHPQSYKSASLAAGSLLQVVDSVMQGESKAGVAVIRPPGHHAEPSEACGFCLLNSVSVAAKYALKNYGLKRIMILDWDVHHGNGTQRIFLSDPQVLYVSIHRYDNGTFFPASKDAAANVVGLGAGVGFNVNIPWNQKGMGNAEYLAAFHQVVLPVAYQFSPELVLVSAGFDAAVGDPLGGCKVSPEAYGLLTSLLVPLAMGRIIICLEGGYNLTSISYAMTMCTKTLLGDPVPTVDLQLPLKASAIKDLKSVLDVQTKHWSALNFNKDFPKEDVLKIVSAKQNDIMKNIDYSFNKISLLDNTSDGEANGQNVIENINKKCESQMSISKESSLLNESPKPNPTERDRLLTQVPNNEREKASSSVKLGDDISNPGPSQSTSSNDKAMELHSTKIDSILKEMGVEAGFAVYPNHDCPHLDAITAVPASGINTASPCLECESDSSAILENWTCLTCYSVHCGRVVNEHMMFHSAELSHPIVLGFQDLSVWCYSCDSYIESPVLYDAKNAAYVSKFGEVMPNIYGQ